LDVKTAVFGQIARVRAIFSKILYKSACNLALIVLLFILWKNSIHKKEENL